MDPTAGGQTPEGWPQITRPTGEKILETARAAREMAAEGLMFEDRKRCQRALELLRDSAQDLLALEQGATPHHLAENLARRDGPLARELHAQGGSEDAPSALGWTSGEDAGRRGEKIFEAFQESMERMSQDFRDQSAHGLSQAMTQGLEARMKRDMDEETEYEAWEQLDQARDGARRALAANDPQGFGRSVRTLAQAAGRTARSAGAG